MSTKLKRVENPELFFGFVAPIGADIEECAKALSGALEEFNYNPNIIRVTDIFAPIQKQLNLDVELKSTPLEERYATHIKYGDAIRNYFQDDAFLALTAIDRIVRLRSLNSVENPDAVPEKNAYLIRQLKRREEIELLRSVYGKLFFQISVYSKRDSRVDNLSRKIASSHYSFNANQYRHSAESLVQTDENEITDDHGQRVGDIFHEADFIINTDLGKEKIHHQVKRFVYLLFGSNIISPTRMEYGLYAAKSASLRTLDLSRQVGAAVFSDTGEIISIGTNEVPKGEGGTYWADDDFDDREFKRELDSNDRRKKEVLSELIEAIKKEYGVDVDVKNPKILKTQFMDALEYGRVIHAEMSAICDAARIGRPLKNSILYCTTFPCHMCAKHIVASGIKQVVFLEPYPKSLASDLHSDSIEIEGQSRGAYDEFPSVLFRHFHGVSPRRYRDLFERQRRKDKMTGKLQEYIHGNDPKCIVDLKIPLYLRIENQSVQLPLIEYYQKANIDTQLIYPTTPT